MFCSYYPLVSTNLPPVTRNTNYKRQETQESYSYIGYVWFTEAIVGPMRPQSLSLSLSSLLES